MMNQDKTIMEEPCHSGVIIVPCETPISEIFKPECLVYNELEPNENYFEMETDPLCMRNETHCEFRMDDRMDKYEISTIPKKHKLRNCTAVRSKTYRLFHEKEKDNTMHEKEQTRIDNDNVILALTKKRDIYNGNTHLSTIIKERICPMCNNVFVSLTTFIEHWNVVHKENTMQICERDYMTNEGFKLTKIKVTDLKLTKFYSRKVKSNNSTTAPNKSMDVKTEGNYACPVCSISFTLLTDLIDHVDIHKASQKKFCCIVCNLRLKSQRALNEHKKTHEKEKFNPVQVKKQANADDRISDLPRKRKNPFLGCDLDTEVNAKSSSCPICKMNFVEITTFMKHLKDAHSVDNTTSCPICNLDFRGSKNASLTLHMWDHSNGKILSRPLNRLSNYVKYVNPENKVTEYERIHYC